MSRERGVVLGSTGLMVSRLSFGTVFMGYQGDDVSPPNGAALLLHAFERGVYFWDTSDDYGTHEHVAHALRRLTRNEVVISTKTLDPDKPVEHLLGELGTTYIDILFAHDVAADGLDAARTLLGNRQPDKVAGRIRALGIATHSAVVAEAACEWPEVDVLMLPINSTGYCQKDLEVEGGIDKMMAVAERSSGLGKGIVAIKVMGCGTLADDPESAISLVSGLKYVDSLCIGMRSTSEIDQNVDLLANCAS